MYSRERLRSWFHPEQPLLRICLWPFSHSTLLLNTLCAEPGTSALSSEAFRQEKEPNTRQILDRLESDDVQALVLSAPSHVNVELLHEVAQHMPKGKRLVLLTERLEDWGHLPLVTVLPQHTCLSLQEVELLFESSDAASAAYDLTAGWPGPTEFLARRSKDPSRFDELLDGPELARQMEEKVLSGMSESELQILGELALVGPIDPEDWRQMVVDEPQRLAAFEQIFRRRLWLIPDTSGWRLPGTLSRYLRNRGMEPSREKVRDVQALRDELEIARASRLDRLLSLRDDKKRPAKGYTAPIARSNAGDPSIPRGHDGSTFRLELLGPPRLLSCSSEGRQEEISWRLKRSFRCVAYLALAPERARPKSAMIEDLWRDEPSEAAERNFHPTLSDARKTLGSPDAIVYFQGMYRLGSGLPLSVDSDQMRHHWDEARQILDLDDPKSTGSQEQALEHLQAAWALYRGPLMQDVEDAWLQELREELRRLYVALLRRLADLAKELGRTPLALDALRSLLIVEPFDEHAHVAVMDIYGRSGRRDLVRRQFVHLQDQLKELRVEPSREAVSAYNRWMG